MIFMLWNPNEEIGNWLLIDPRVASVCASDEISENPLCDLSMLFYVAQEYTHFKNRRDCPTRCEQISARGLNE